MVLGDVGVVHGLLERLCLAENLEGGSAEADIIWGWALLGYPYNELLETSPYKDLRKYVSETFSCVIGRAAYWVTTRSRHYGGK